MWCGDVIYGRDASALRSREVKKRTRPDYSTRTGRNVQLSAPKLGLRRGAARPRSYFICRLLANRCPGQNFFHLFSFPLLTQQYSGDACTGEISYSRFSDQTFYIRYLAVHVTASNFVWSHVFHIYEDNFLRKP